MLLPAANGLPIRDVAQDRRGYTRSAAPAPITPEQRLEAGVDATPELDEEAAAGIRPRDPGDWSRYQFVTESSQLWPSVVYSHIGSLWRASQGDVRADLWPASTRR